MSKTKTAYGNGSVYFQGTNYIAQLLYTVEIDGKEYSKRVSGSGKTEAAAVRKRNKNAKKWADKLRESLRQPEENDTLESNREEDNGPTLNEVFDMNFSLKGTHVQIPTSDNYETYFNGYIRNTDLGKTPIREITEEQLLAFYKLVRVDGRKRVRKGKDGKPEKPKPLSIRTVNYIRFVVFNTFKYAEEKGIIDKNVHSGIRPFKAGTLAMMDFEQEDLDGDSDDTDALQRVIPMEEMESVLAYAYEHSRLAGLFAWALNCGMRQGECLGLKSSLADPAAGYIFVKKSLTYIKDRRENAGQKLMPKLKLPKNGKERKIPYNANLENIYRYQMEQNKREKEAAGALYQDRGLLFSDEYGDFLRPWKVLKEFQDILEALGLKKHRFHDLRHTFVSLLVKESQKNGEGISILDVCAIVGHKDAQVTLSVYAGLFPNSTERAMKVLNMCDAIKLPQQNGKKSCA